MYLELRGELARRGQTLKTMAIKIHKSYSYVCKCACGECNFDLKDAYAILDWLNIPYSDLSRIFPKNGIDLEIDKR